MIKYWGITLHRDGVNEYWILASTGKRHLDKEGDQWLGWTWHEQHQSKRSRDTEIKKLTGEWSR